MCPKILAACLGTLVGAVLSARAGALQDWNQWRGPRRDGSAPSLQAPAAWPRALARAWRVEVGEGHSSPVVQGGAVFIHARQGEQEIVRRLAIATGRVVWRDRYPAPYEMDPAARAHGKGPRATPVVQGGRLFTFGISGVLSAYDAARGTLLWRHTFAGEFPATAPEFGTASSPLVDGDRVVAYTGGKGQGALTAFEAATGRVRWRWTGDGPGYASPILATLGGTRQLITQSQNACIGLDPANGSLLWRLPFTTPYEQNSVTPVVAGELLVLGGTGQPTTAYRLRRAGAGWTPERVWSTRDATLYMSTPVLYGNRLLGMSERRSGQLFSLDAASGRTTWTGPARAGDNAALIIAGRWLLAQTTGAELLVYDVAGPEPRAVARYRVAESPTWATPAPAGASLLVKDLQHLARWTIPSR
jgi:outer membrane protein assembly factor BamB